MALADLRRLAAQPVTHVTHDAAAVGHTPDSQKIAEICRTPGPVTHVTRVTREKEKGGARAEGDATPHLAHATPDQAEAERQDRAAIAAEPPPAATVPVPPATLAEWEQELAALLARHPAHTLTDPAAAASYFAAEARRRLGAVRHDRQAAGLLIGFWRHARGART